MDTYGFGIGAIIDPRDGNSGGFFTARSTRSPSTPRSSTRRRSPTTTSSAIGAAADVTGPTGGSVDASGLVGTGSRYATSTTLSLDLAKGTDPSGVATTGNQLLRATATLTSAGTADGVCGTFGAYTLDHRRHRPGLAEGRHGHRPGLLQLPVRRARHARQPTTYTSPDIKVDLTAPAAPTLTLLGVHQHVLDGTGATVYYRSAASHRLASPRPRTATRRRLGHRQLRLPGAGHQLDLDPGRARREHVLLERSPGRARHQDRHRDQQRRPRPRRTRRSRSPRTTPLRPPARSPTPTATQSTATVSVELHHRHRRRLGDRDPAAAARRPRP